MQDERVSLHGRIHEQPYEHHALEGLLAIVKTFEEQEFAAIAEAFRRIFLLYRNGSTPGFQAEKEVKSLKTYLQLLKKRVEGYKSTLVDITNDDNSMAMMNLSYLEEKPQLYR